MSGQCKNTITNSTITYVIKPILLASYELLFLWRQHSFLISHIICGQQGGKLTEDDGGRAGRGALRIFRQSSQKLTPSKWYPPPEVPKDYRPFHYFTTTLYTDGTVYTFCLPFNVNFITLNVLQYRYAWAEDECGFTRGNPRGDTTSYASHATH